MLLILCASLLVLQGALAQGPRCPQGWVPYTNQCYLFGTATYTWKEAKDVCTGRQAALVSIKTKAEGTFISTQVKSLKNDYWIGLSDTAKEGTLVWLDKKVPYNKANLPWSNGQPDDYKKKEDCGHFWKNGLLNDAPCANRYRYICKRSLYIADKCDLENGWHPVGTKCYRFFQRSRNWQEARTSCQDNDGDLIAISNIDERRFVTDSVTCPGGNFNVWVGLSDLIDRTNYKWVDNTAVDSKLSNWDNGQPKSVSQAGDNCVTVQSGNNYKWRTEPCSMEAKYICERPQGKCPTGWQAYFGQCFQAYSGKDARSWTDALKFCQSQGTTLLRMDNNGERNFVKMKLSPNMRAANVPDFWVAVSDKDKDGIFTTSDGAPLTYKPWAGGNPKNNKGRMDCVIVRTADRNAQWVTESCFNSRAFVCEMKITDKLITATSQTPSPYSCEQGWLLFNGNCYWFETKEETFKGAFDKCNDGKKAILTSIADADEQSFISANLKATSFFGLNDNAVEGKFTYVDGTPFTVSSFKNWSPNEPNNYKSSEDCVSVLPSRGGQWNDLPCSNKAGYICKKKGIVGAVVSTSPPTTRPWSPLCGPYWLYDPSNNFCYLVSDDMKTYADARSTCQTQNGDLLSIGSPHEQTFMTAIMLTYVSGAGSFWIGANDLSAEGGWEWSDGTPFRYLNWYPGEPNAWGGGEDCVVMSPSRQGRWNDAKCGKKFRYLCKKSTTAVTTAVSPFATDAPPQVCTPEAMISGNHSLPDSAIIASSVWNANHGAMNSRLDWMRAAGVTTVNTKNEYKYISVPRLDLRGATYIRLNIRACNDAHINLMADASSTDKNTYEVVIGGWANKKSVIRESKQQNERASANTDKYLDCKNFRQFWISWDGGYIKVGTGNKIGDPSTIFLSWQDPTPYAVGAMSVSTGWGATGIWQVYNPFGGRTGAWSAKVNKKGEWIQADFQHPIMVNGIITQGRSDYKQWVTSYIVQYKYNDANKWATYQDPAGKIKVFQGNKDQNTKVTNKVDFPFEARYVRIVPQTWYGHISMRFDVEGCIVDECNPANLVTGDIRVENAALTASSFWNAGKEPFNARLDLKQRGNIAGGWASSGIDVNQWIQVDLGMDYRVRGVTTQGRSDAPQWVTSYKISYKRIGDKDYTFYQEPYGTVKGFIGNKDQNTKVTNLFTSPFIAQLVRIHPMTWNSHISLRFDVLGCLKGCDPIGLISGPHAIPDEELRASSQFSNNHDPVRSRLNTQRKGALIGSWSSKYNRKGQWIEADLGVSMSVVGIVTQGRQDMDQWVKTYMVSFSLDRKKWFSYYENSKKKLFNGNWDRNTVRTNMFTRPFNARYVRLYPQTWQRHMSLRWEVYACPVTGDYTKAYIGCFEDNSKARDLPFAPMTAKSLWIAMCIKHCFQNGYVYTGVQYGKYCFCGNTYGAHGPSSRCTTKCSGGQTPNCGGSFANSIYSTGVAPTSMRCEDSWKPYGNDCYQVTSDTRLTWQDARDACRSQGGDLASIHTPVEYSFVTTLTRGAPDSIWVGLNDLDHQMYFEWSDGSEVTLTKWNKNEPNNWRGKKEDCVQIFRGSGLWNDEPCDRKLPYMCKQPKQVLPAATVPATLPGCDQGWLAYTYTCYLFSPYPRNWASARSFCKGFGASLVRVHEGYEQAFLSSVLGSKDSGMYWTDLTDNIQKGTYTWSSGNFAITFSNWDKNQPDDRTGQCVALATGKSAGLWRDRSCNTRYSLICEKLRKGYTSPQPPTHPITPPPCASGWYGWGDNCFQINAPDQSNLRKSWVEARADCIAKGGELASFHNATELDLVWRDNLIGGGLMSYWIGFNTRNTDLGYVWSDKSAVIFTKWNDNEPNNWQGRENCAELLIQTGKWNDVACETLRNWICKIPNTKSPVAINTTPAPTPDPAGCGTDGPDWKLYKGKCYFFGNGQGDMKKSWRQASQYCMDNGGYLTSILSQDTQNFLQGQIATLGLRQIWIGLNELSVGSGHRWVDGQPGVYYNWATSEPNDWGGGEACVAMLIRGGKWNDEHCSFLTGFICEKYKGAVPITTPNPAPLPGFCPSGYYTFKNKCFKIYSQPDDYKNWTFARDACKQNSDFLASFQTADENTFLTSKLYGVDRALWIGMAHLRGQNFMWTDNEDVTYTNWDQGEPNGRDKEPCVELLHYGSHHAGRWNDISCEVERGYVCMTYRKANILTEWVEPNPCPKNWASLGEGCYYLVNSASNWDGAKQRCQAEGSNAGTTANLVSVTSEIEQSFLYIWMKQNALKQKIWIGLSDQMSVGTYNWVDHWPVVYTNWGNNEPSKGDNEGCVSFGTDGMWVDGNCGQQLAAVCKSLPASVTPIYTQPPLVGGQCPNDDDTWLPFNGFCYLFKIMESKSFADASFECNTRFAESVSIHSGEESAFLSNQMSTLSWKSVWTSLLKNRDGGFVWKDNTPVQYTKWADGEPNDFKGENSENCVELYASGLWNDEDCSVGRGYVCKMAMVTAVSSNTPPNNTPPTVPTLSPGGTYPSGKTYPPGSSSTKSPGSTTMGGPKTAPAGTTKPGSQAIPRTAPSDPTATTFEIIGIVIGCVAIICIVAFAVYYIRTKNQARGGNGLGFDNALYSSSNDSVKVNTSVDFESTNRGFTNPMHMNSSHTDA